MTDADTNTNKWVDRIQKLLNKAESTNSPEEAEALTAKAEELMIKFTIDHAMLAASGHVTEKIIEKKIEYSGIYAKQHVELAFQVCVALGNLQSFYSQVQRLNTTAKRTRTDKFLISHIIGYETDVETAIVLITSLQVQCQRAELSWWRERREHIVNLEVMGYGKTTPMEKFKMRRSFFIGFNERVHARLSEIHRRTVKEAETQTAGTELVLRSRQANVETWVANNYKLRSGSTRNVSVETTGRIAGRLAGDAADIGRGRVGGSGRGQLEGR